MNKMRLEFSARSDNEGFARTAAAAFMLALDPTLEELSEIKTAVSEAVTNSIIHGYGNDKSKMVILEGVICENIVTFTIKDRGKGIYDIEKAREPMYTDKPQDERSGMGFTIMESFMDSVEVYSEVGNGTSVIMTKSIGADFNER